MPTRLGSYQERYRHALRRRQRGYGLVAQYHESERGRCIASGDVTRHRKCAIEVGSECGTGAAREYWNGRRRASMGQFGGNAMLIMVPREIEKKDRGRSP